MSVQLNHTIVLAHDAEKSSRFFTEMFGLPEAQRWGPFMDVEVANGVTMAYMSVGADFDIPAQHYAFLITEDEFDEIFGRIQDRGLDYWADPHKHQSSEINHDDGGRGVYFDDPNGHLLEIITRPYGSGS
jgi:catechol 2,3-dioxygenase-like lactoylglutathione lyase family enzyme